MTSLVLMSCRLPPSLQRSEKVAVIYAHNKKQNSIKSVHSSLSQLNTSQLQKQTEIDAALLIIVCSKM